MSLDETRSTPTPTIFSTISEVKNTIAVVISSKEGGNVIKKFSQTTMTTYPFITIKINIFLENGDNTVMTTECGLNVITEVRSLRSVSNGKTTSTKFIKCE